MCHSRTLLPALKNFLFQCCVSGAVLPCSILISNMPRGYERTKSSSLCITIPGLRITIPNCEVWHNQPKTKGFYVIGVGVLIVEIGPIDNSFSHEKSREEEIPGVSQPF